MIPVPQGLYDWSHYYPDHIHTAGFPDNPLFLIYIRAGDISPRKQVWKISYSGQWESLQSRARRWRSQDYFPHHRFPYRCINSLHSLLLFSSSTAQRLHLQILWWHLSLSFLLLRMSGYYNYGPASQDLLPYLS